MCLSSCELRKVIVGFVRNCAAPWFVVNSVLSAFVLFLEPLCIEFLADVELILGRIFSTVFEFLC